MKAVVYEKYGPPEVLELREVDRPAPGPREVLVRVHAAGAAAGDWHLLTADMFAVRLYQGLFRPKRRILGHDFAGTVEAVGDEVTRFRPGDEVFGESAQAGAFAEFVAVPERTVAAKPKNLTFEEAAVVPVSAITALQGLRDKGKIQSGSKVLINGAAGGVGTFAVQIAKSLGAEVTAVVSANKVDLAKSLGADHVVDYREQDFTEGDQRYDLILDLVGKHPLPACKRVLARTGIYVAVAGAVSRTLRVALFGGKRMVGFIAMPNGEDLERIRAMIEAGELKPVIERRCSLAQVADALRHLGEGHAAGKTVVTVLADESADRS